MTDHQSCSAGSVELLPCPFCGGDVHLADTGVHWVVCNVCSAEGPPADTEADAIAKWSVRSRLGIRSNLSGDVAQSSQVAILRDALKNMMGAYDTPLSRRRFPPDEFMKAAIESGRAALAAQPPAKFIPCTGCDGHECDNGCAYPGATKPPAAPVETDDAKIRNSYLQRALDAEDDVLRLHNEKMKMFERAIEAEAKLTSLQSCSAEPEGQAANKPAIDPKQIKAIDDFLADGERDRGYRAFAMMRHLWPRLREMALGVEGSK